LSEDGVNNELLVKNLLPSASYTISMLMKNYMKTLMEPIMNEAFLYRENEQSEPEDSESSEIEEPLIKKSKKESYDNDLDANLDDPEEDERDSPQELEIPSDQEALSDIAEKIKKQNVITN
jgi:hypothetical protein